MTNLKHQVHSPSARAIVLHYGPSWEALAATSLIKRLVQEHGGKLRLDWATTNESYPLFKYNSRIENLFIGEPTSTDSYDVIYDLSRNEQSTKICEALQGSACSVKDSYCYAYLAGERVDSHVLQVLFKLAGLSWRGEGYDLAYYPKNKVKKGKTGVAISRDDLRSYVKDNLQLSLSELWHIPLRKNLLKRIDEINRCKRIVTDDLFTAHAAIALRKHVEFLDKDGFHAEIEFFGKGNHLRLNDDRWKLQMSET